MTPSKMTGSKNYAFNRQIKGVGRIQQSSGTSSLKQFHRRDAILTKLIEASALETLRLFKAGDITIGDLVDADRAGRHLQVADRLVLHKPLKPAVDAWLPNSAPSVQGRRRYKTSWEHFFRASRLRKAATVYDLARLDYAKLSTKWNAGPADWNRARAAVSSFLTNFLGHVHHPFRLEVMRYYKLKAEPEGPIPDVTAAQFWEVIVKARVELRASFVAMAVLGAGPDEYLRLTPDHLNRRQHLVKIPGTKTRGRARTVAVDERMWPWVQAAVPSPLHYRWLNTWWKRACAEAGYTLRMYDLRHLSAQFAGDEGATDRDLTIHMGHSNVRMSHRYSRRKVARKVAAALADALVAGMPKELIA